MDSRLNVFAALGLRDGEAHVLRNAGGVITDDVVASSTTWTPTSCLKSMSASRADVTPGYGVG